MTVLSMSRAEIDRLHVLRDVIADRIIAERISARDAAQLMGMTTRQVFRCLPTTCSIQPLREVKRLVVIVGRRKA